MKYRLFDHAEVQELVVHETRKFSLAHWISLIFVFGPIVIIGYYILTGPK
ncbi:MAG TPA: hypothetical protein VL335_02005 [Candidatus Paceibacterota bacterium]|jgi:hypothetical protein|nr:hypothetical protein [Candidatus Paceibacterota bacterium]